MNNKKILWAALIGLGMIFLAGIILILAQPKNMGPIQPFLNLRDSFRFINTTGEFPGKPAYYQITRDCNTGDVVREDRQIQPDPGCDNWEANRFERPFNAVTQDTYFPDLDIQNAYIGRDGDWYYLRMALFDSLPGTEYLSGDYALEMDLDVDGRGDLLILVSEPGRESGRKWSVQGVQIWVDSNNDVGGAMPKIPEGMVLTDGYDTLLFDQGRGDDPSGAWARVFMTGSAYLEVAFKNDYLDGDIAFKWWVWSGNGSYAPGLFDLHDFYTREKAGAVYQGMDVFPSKEVYALDSSCANMWGASPDPADPAYCFDTVKDPEYNTRVMLKCAIPFLPCKIPREKPGDEPCVLNFEEWLYSVWEPAHQGESLPPEDGLWNAFGEYLKDPFCPPDGLITPTYTPSPTATNTPTPTFTPAPTETPTPRSPICNYDCGCEPDQGENEINCPSDCPQHCGNDVCDCGETRATCPDDCRPDCKRDLSEVQCKEAGGTWTLSAVGLPYCKCP